MPRISIIIPNYNNAHYLGNAVQSILNQTFTDYEIIVVDDGSTDNSRDVVGAFGDKVRYVWQENKGLGGARNTGILASNAEFIGLLDADDEWKPAYLEKMMFLAECRSDAVVYYCGAQGMDAAGKDLPQVFGRTASSDNIYQNLLRANFIIPSTVVFRRGTILEAGLFEEKNRDLHGCEDWDLWLRLSPSYQFVGIAEPLVRYRLHTNTFSANPEHMQNAVRAVIEKNFGLYDGNYADWSADKRRAFGGVYRYQTIAFVHRGNNWDAAGCSLQQALMADPSLALDLDFFYELGLGNQQAGFRGTSEVQDLDTNAFQLEKIIHPLQDISAMENIYKKAIGTAEYALGLLAYGFGKRSASRKYLLKALSYRPELVMDPRLSGNFLKSFIDKVNVNRIKDLLGRIT